MTGRPVVWLAGVSWDGIRGTDRHLATALSAHVPVLWVDPPVSPATRSDRRAGTGRAPRPRLSDVDGRITRLSTVALPGLTRPGVRGTTAPLVRAQLRWALRRLGTTPRAVVATYLEDVLGRWGDGPVDVLYGTDDLVAGAELLGLSAARLRRQERRALDRADVVLAVSDALVERWAGLGARPVLLPNGCAPPADLPAAVPTGLPAPVAGVVGQLSERIDLGLLEAVAAAGISLLLVGPRDPRWEPVRFAALVARPHVRHTGRVPAEAVPGHLAAIDVGLTPYADSAFNRASFPLKTLEYLAAGRPVVSTDLPAARALLRDPDAADALTVASGPADFVAAVRAAAVRGPGVADRARAVAGRNSWSCRAEQLAAAVGPDILTAEPLEVSS